MQRTLVYSMRNWKVRNWNKTASPCVPSAGNTHFRRLKVSPTSMHVCEWPQRYQQYWSWSYKWSVASRQMHKSTTGKWCGLVVWLPKTNTIIFWPISTLATIRISDYGVERRGLREWGQQQVCFDFLMEMRERLEQRQEEQIPGEQPGSLTRDSGPWDKDRRSKVSLKWTQH